MPYAGLLDADARIELLSKRAAECQTSDDHEHAIAAWEEALVLLRAAGRDLDVVEALLGMDESYYTIGDNSRGTEFVDEALSVLDGAGAEPAAGAGHRSARRTPPAGVRVRGRRCRGSSEPSRWDGRSGTPRWCPAPCPTRAVARLLLGEHAAGRELVEEALQVALAHDLEDSVARNYQTLSWTYWMDLNLVEAHALLEEAERYTAERDLHGQLLCVLGQRDHVEDGAGALGRSRRSGARPALRAEHRPRQPDRAAGGARPAECAAR